MACGVACLVAPFAGEEFGELGGEGAERVPLTDGPVRTIPIPALVPLTVGWAARQWNVLSPLAAEFAELVAGGAG